MDENGGNVVSYTGRQKKEEKPRLCSDRAGFITGENICVDGGMTRLMIYHGDNGWSYRP